MKILGWNSNSSRLRLAREIGQIAKRLSKKAPGVVLLSRAQRYIRENEVSAAIEELDRFVLVAVDLDSTNRAVVQSVQSELRRNNKFGILKAIRESAARFFLNQLYIRALHVIMSTPQIS